MGVVHLLDRGVSELIAAGEVVERPASVAKELIENAIDAGATLIIIEVAKGGLAYLKVSDNGSGFYRDDVKTAFLRHATSKVQTAEDLESIHTMGFRGEALASIAAVAKIELVSCHAGEDFGVRYQIEGGEETLFEDAGGPVGTVITVKDLFYNTPARRKFLKKDLSEANAVASITEKIALAHPEVSFRFIKDGEEKLRTPGDGKLLSAIYAVYGRDFAAGLLPVRYSRDGFAISGYVSKPHTARANRSMQNFFVNRRYIRAMICTVALEEGFKHELMSKKFPACILNLDLPADFVDVNVHPAKTEVRFEQEKRIFDLVYFGVKNALQNQDLKTFSSAATVGEQTAIGDRQGEKRTVYTGLPDIFGIGNGKKEPADGTKREIPPMAPARQETILADDSEKYIVFDTSGGQAQSWPPAFKPTRANIDIEADEEYKVNTLHPKTAPRDLPGQKNEPVFAQEEKTEDAPQNLLRNEELRYVGEALKTYIILEGDGALILVDKHAAHERILYNKLKSGRTEEYMQKLLSPVSVTLAKEEYATAISAVDVFLQFGFEIEDFGGGSVLVRSAPMWLAGAEIENTVAEICGNLQAGKRDVAPERLDWLYHNISCRSAIKGGEQNSAEELKEIIKLLKEDKEAYHCPHGRPVAVVLTQKEIEKQFGRIV